MKFFITLILCLGTFNIYAQQEEIEQLLSVQNNGMSGDISFSSTGKTEAQKSFSYDAKGYQMSSKSAAKAQKTVFTNVITYQYTTDGWLQHVAVYSDGIICTNLAGPREGLQIAILEHGAMDMCHSYKMHKDHKSHKYSWGEVRTYENYQTVIFK
jgi:hypothetical protein